MLVAPDLYYSIYSQTEWISIQECDLPVDLFVEVDRSTSLARFYSSLIFA